MTAFAEDRLLPRARCMCAGPQVRLSEMCSRTAAARAHSRPALAPAGTRMMRAYGVAGPRMARASGGAAAQSRAQRRAWSHRSASASIRQWHRCHGTSLRARACHMVLARPYAIRAACQAACCVRWGSTLVVLRSIGAACLNPARLTCFRGWQVAWCARGPQQSSAHSRAGELR